MNHDIETIAQLCHETNRAYCAMLYDFTQLPWQLADEWQRQSARDGVRFALENPDAPASALHLAWCESKVADGWTYGPIKDPSLKQHPCLVPYDQLPEEQRRKDVLFRGVVRAMTAVV